MNRDDKDAIATLAERLKSLLDTRRDHFVIDAKTLGDANSVDLGTPTDLHAFSTAVEVPDGAAIVDDLAGPTPHRVTWGESRTVSAASLKLVYDWCVNDWPMSLEEFLSGMFHGKEWDKKTPTYHLIPEAKDRLSADNLGFGHLYPPKDL